MKNKNFNIPKGSILSNLKHVKKDEKLYYILNIDIVQNKFIFFNKLFILYSKANKLNNSFRLSDFCKIIIDVYFDYFKENNLLDENYPEDFESFLKLKKRGVLEGMQMYSGMSSKDIYTHTTIKMSEETYKKYIVCIYSYIKAYDSELQYHYSLRKFMNNIVTFVMKNEDFIKSKCNIWEQ